MAHAHAKQCAPGKFEDNAKTADIIFEGKVIEREPHEITSRKSICWQQESGNNALCGGKLATFEINTLWKGDYTEKTIEVYSEDACYCLGNYFEEDKNYIVFGYKNSSVPDWKTTFSTAGSVCQGTIPLANHTVSKETRKQLDNKFKK